MFDNVVVGVNDFAADRDLGWLAKALASRESEITLAHVQVVRSRPAPDSGAAGYAARRRSAVERLAALRDEWQLDAEVICREARSVRQGLHDLARARDADLLVIGATRQDDLSREIAGEDAREVLDDPPCAVAVAPPGCSEREVRMGKIGVAYDGSAQSTHAVAVARRLAEERHAELVAFRAVPASIYAHDPWNADGEIAERVEAARTQIGRLGGVEAVVEPGETIEELVRFGRSVDLLVLGSHRRRVIDGPPDQRTAQRVADAGSFPLLVLSSSPPEVQTDVAGEATRAGLTVARAASNWWRRTWTASSRDATRRCWRQPSLASREPSCCWCRLLSSHAATCRGHSRATPRSANGP